ncbi:MAG: hypothetical protein R2716_04970 [Microthrixaceae bacterium]
MGTSPRATPSTAPEHTAGLWDRRWRGAPNRLEVWYATFTDRASGSGLWLHGELVAPADGSAPTRLGWAALFPAEGEPVWARTGTIEGDPSGDPATFECPGLTIGPGGSAGEAGPLSWQLDWDSSGQRGMATFGRPAWERELLPGAQVVPAPDLSVDGWVDNAGTRLDLEGAHGAVARIYGHGNAQRWAWLHAELGGGDLLELVTAVSTRPVLERLPPVTFIRFRLDGVDWPGAPVPALGLRSRISLPRWTVGGRIGRARVHIEVDQPEERNVAIDYHDPDGRTATCTNTERADLRVVVDRGPGGRSRRWELRGTAHAEVGTRP